MAKEDVLLVRMKTMNTVVGKTVLFPTIVMDVTRVVAETLSTK